MNTTTVITGERANDLASEWYLVSLFLKSPLVLLRAAGRIWARMAVPATPVLAGLKF